MSAIERVDHNELLHELLTSDGFFVERTNHENAEVSSDEALERQESLNETAEAFAREVQADDTQELEKDKHVEKGKSKGKLKHASRKEDWSASLKGSTQMTNQGKLSIPPASGSTSSYLLQSIESDTNVIAVLAVILSLCALQGAEFQKNIWEQATTNMMQSITLATPIANAVKASGEANADATRSEASMNRYDGIIMLGFAGVSLFMGLREVFAPEEKAGAIGAEATKPEENAATQAQTNTNLMQDQANAAGSAPKPPQPKPTPQPNLPSGPGVDEKFFGDEPPIDRGLGNPRDLADDQPANGAQAAAQQNGAQAAAQQNVARAANGQAAPAGNAAKSQTVQVTPNGGVTEPEKGWWERLTGGSKGFMAKCFKAYAKGSEKAQMSQMMAQGSVGLNDAHYKTQQATHQQEAGEDDATSKQGEMVAQFENQAFQRAEDVRQSNRQQGVDNVCNIWKSGVDTITQAMLAQHA